MCLMCSKDAILCNVVVCDLHIVDTVCHKTTLGNLRLLYVIEVTYTMFFTDLNALSVCNFITVLLNALNSLLSL